MADKDHNRDHTGGPGVVQKAASLGAHEVTEAELKAINKHTLEPLKAEDVFTFKAVLCDNEIDRTHEHFTLKALQDFQKLFIGKTVIKDHERSADNQVARIYATELAESGKITKTGEPYTQLVAHCYMVRTERNADLIAEIKAGIKKEGSIGCSASSCICSICGTDNAKTYCRHWPGKDYDKESGKIYIDTTNAIQIDMDNGWGTGAFKSHTRIGVPLSEGEHILKISNDFIHRFAAFKHLCSCDKLDNAAP